MSNVRYLLGNISFINIILTASLAFLVNYMPPTFLNTGILSPLPATEKHEQMDPDSGNKPDQAKTPSPFEYVVVAEQNLFHPERKIPVEKEATEPKPLPKPDFVLYGTFVSDDIKIAYMKDMKLPYSTPGRGERQVALHLGESLSGYTVSEIYSDMVEMIKGDDRIEISVLDPAKMKSRATGAITPNSPGKSVSRQKQPAAKTPRADKSSRKEDKPQSEKNDDSKKSITDKTSKERNVK